ncbi:hypothetical protein ACFT4A_13295 [Streptomyces sp. NPDC057099]|uniref:hypothetical protein n=1 Tax=Streptomyces sp. NPDC057099 TaxID=3346019 RepID=UPI00362BDC5E
MQPLPHAENPTVPRPRRLRTAWQAAHQPTAGVSRPIQLLAYAVPLVVLPSGIWRLPAVLDDGTGPGEGAYIVFLSILSEALAFTAIGLIARWGEVFPRWIPLLGGRRVPLGPTVIASATAATLLTLGTTLTLVTQILGTTIRGDALPANFPSEAGGWETAWFYACYAPLILWGPLLAVLTIAYGKRRRAGSPRSAGA